MPQVNDLNQTKRAATDVPVHELVAARWSPRAFKEQAVTDTDLKTLFTAASWAASSRNEQPWRFLVGRKGDETYKKIFDSLVPANQSWAGSAPVLYASFASKTFAQNGSPNAYGLHDVGAASATLALQAASMGLHVHGMGGFDKDTLRAFFGVPSNFEAGAVWALGYLGDPESLPDNYKQPEKDPRSRNPLPSFVFSAWEQPATF